jgi:hypothetical protein
MTLPPRLLGAAAVAVTTASLAIPSAAGAKAGDRTFQQTYPVASRVCENVAAGKSKRLKRFTPQVLADCAALQSGFTAAQSTVLATRAAIASAIAADRTTIAVACPPPLAGRPACEQTRHAETLAITALRRQQVHAARRFYRTVEANRLRFWKAIRALPGERNVREDAPIAELPA